MKAFSLKIVTPEGILFDGEAESLLCRTVGGDVEILAGHTALFAPLGTGRARLLIDGAERLASASGGFLSVTKEGAVLSAVTFEFAESIDLDRAKKAKEKAEALLAAKKDETSERLAKAKLARALTRISVAEK